MQAGEDPHERCSSNLRADYNRAMLPVQSKHHPSTDRQRLPHVCVPLLRQNQAQGPAQIRCQISVVRAKGKSGTGGDASLDFRSLQCVNELRD